jgi:hypothetical protein
MVVRTLQTGNSRPFATDSSITTSDLSRSNSFVNKKPILKKRSLSEVMLQRSLSSSSLMKQAIDALRAQQCGAHKSMGTRPLLDLAVSDLANFLALWHLKVELSQVLQCSTFGLIVWATIAWKAHPL